MKNLDEAMLKQNKGKNTILYGENYKKEKKHRKEQTKKKKIPILKLINYTLLTILVIMIVVFIFIFKKRGPKEVVKKFNEALIAREYHKAARLCIIKHKYDDSYIIRGPEEIQILQNFICYQRDIKIDKIIRIDKRYNGTYVYGRAENRTMLVRVKKITKSNARRSSRGGREGDYEVVVLLDDLKYYYLLTD